MRRLIFVTMLVCLHGLALGAEADTPATRRQAAERYNAVTDLPKMLAEMTDAVTQNMPAEKRDEFKKLMTQYVRIDALREAMVIVMVKHFTTRELNALANFYGSTEGKSSMAKFGLYMADVMPMIQAEMQHAVEASRADAEKKPGT
ncbi:MAG TPA: DUF2059 domain-containing protein [Steroidobacteraceae bacterium]|jgi:hypothetical protein|nr:DUF2059 domain-containing protein [Steroidobacteraceae bacterium]